MTFGERKLSKGGGVGAGPFEVSGPWGRDEDVFPYIYLTLDSPWRPD